MTRENIDLDRLETIARIAYGSSIYGGWSSLQESEKTRYMGIAEEVLGGRTYNGQESEELVVRSAAEAWDAAIQYERLWHMRALRTQSEPELPTKRPDGYIIRMMRNDHFEGAGIVPYWHDPPFKTENQ